MGAANNLPASRFKWSRRANPALARLFECGTASLFIAVDMSSFYNDSRFPGSSAPHATRRARGNCCESLTLMAVSRFCGKPPFFMA